MLNPPNAIPSSPTTPLFRVPPGHVVEADRRSVRPAPGNAMRTSARNDRACAKK
jgi:hypothetical protein